MQRDDRSHMPAPPPKNKPKSKPKTRPNSPSPLPAAPQPPETVDPGWLLKALAFVFALGLFCAYVMVCALFYNQQWQFVLNPSRIVKSSPSASGLAFEPVRFGVDAGGQPQLSGWWMPLASGAGPLAGPTALVLHGGAGTISEVLPAARELHAAGLNVLLFDYRGFGASDGAHPSASGMRHDAVEALDYLTTTRGIPFRSVVLYGEGLGASVAVALCGEHPDLPAVILQSADGDTQSRVARDPRARIVPVSLLFHEQFPLADPLRTLGTPKLFLSFTGGNAPLDAARAADPKTTVELPLGTSEPEVTAAIRRFLDTYLRSAPPVLSGRPS